VGCELYVQPKDSRLNLEVKVANANALHWKKALQEANDRNHQLRQERAIYRALLTNVYNLVTRNNVTLSTAAMTEALDDIMESIRKQLVKLNEPG